MKNIIKICAVVCALALGLASCQQEVVPPVLTITGSSQIMVEPEGDDIENPTGISIAFEVYDDAGHKMNFTGNGLTVTATDSF